MPLFSTRVFGCQAREDIKGIKISNDVLTSGGRNEPLCPWIENGNACRHKMGDVATDDDKVLFGGCSRNEEIELTERVASAATSLKCQTPS